MWHRWAYQWFLEILVISHSCHECVIKPKRNPKLKSQMSRTKNTKYYKIDPRKTFINGDEKIPRSHHINLYNKDDFMTLTEFKLCCNVNDIKNLFKSTNHVKRLMWQTCLIKRGIWLWRLKFLSLMVRIKYCIVLKSKYKKYLPCTQNFIKSLLIVTNLLPKLACHGSAE